MPQDIILGVSAMNVGLHLLERSILVLSIENHFVKSRHLEILGEATKVDEGGIVRFSIEEYLCIKAVLHSADSFKIVAELHHRILYSCRQVDAVWSL